MGISPSNAGEQAISAKSDATPSKGLRLFATSLSESKSSERQLIQVLDDEDLDLDTVPGQIAKQRGNWTQEQDVALRLAVKRHEGKAWKLICKEVPGEKTSIQCLQRWLKVLKPGLVKGRWKPEEDELLRKYVPLEAKGDWVGVASHVPGRTAKQCRERWYLCVDPTIRRDPWAPEEDELLLKLHAKLGNGWALISQQLPGRPENAVKYRYNSLKRKMEIEASALKTEQDAGNVKISDRLKKRKLRQSEVSMQDVHRMSQAFSATPSRSSDPMMENKKISTSEQLRSEKSHALPDFGVTDLLDRWLHGSSSEHLYSGDSLPGLLDDSFDSYFEMEDFNVV